MQMTKTHVDRFILWSSLWRFVRKESLPVHLLLKLLSGNSSIQSRQISIIGADLISIPNIDLRRIAQRRMMVKSKSDHIVASPKDHLDQCWGAIKINQILGKQSNKKQNEAEIYSPTNKYKMRQLMDKLKNLCDTLAAQSTTLSFPSLLHPHFLWSCQSEVCTKPIVNSKHLLSPPHSN